MGYYFSDLSCHPSTLLLNEPSLGLPEDADENREKPVNTVGGSADIRTTRRYVRSLQAELKIR